LPQFPAKYVTIKQQQNAQRLILSGSRDLLIDSQMSEKPPPFRFAYLFGIAFVLKKDEFTHLANVSLFGPHAVIANADRGSDLIEQFPFPRYR
jgi:hypothetical protein